MKNDSVDDPQNEIEALGERLLQEAGLELPVESSTETEEAPAERASDRLSASSEEKKGDSSPSKTQVSAVSRSLGTWFVGVLKTSREWARSLSTTRHSSGSESSTFPATVPTTREATAPKKPLGFRVTKKIAVTSVSGALVAIISIVGLVNFAFMTVNEGIETTLGSSENRTVFVLKADDAERNDLVVAVLKRASTNGDDLLILGTVFSKNDQTYALYDGEVIWQIPIGNIRGKVFFASATQTP